MLATDPHHSTGLSGKSLRQRLWLGGGGLALFLLILAAGSVIPPGRQAPWRVLGRDFFVAYCAGTLAREGRWADLHDVPAFMRFQGEMEVAVGLEPSDKRGPWLNPPFYALVWMPLSALPYPAAWWTWTGTSVAALAASVWLLGRMAGEDLSAEGRGPSGCRGPHWPLIAVLLGCSMPAVQTLCSGQSSALALFIMVAAVALWRDGRALPAGLVAGLLAYKPQLGALVAAALVITLGWRALLGLLITGALLFVTTVVALPGTLELYLRATPETVGMMQETGRFVWNRHVTFGAFWHLLLHGRGAAEGLSVRALVLVCQAMVAGGLAALVWRNRWAFSLREPALPAVGTVMRDRLIAAMVVAMPLLMPYYVDYDLLLLAVPAVLLARELSAFPNDIPAHRWLIRGWTALYLWLFLNPALAGPTRFSLTVPLLAAVAGGMIVRAWRDGAERTRAAAAAAPLTRTNNPSEALAA